MELAFAIWMVAIELFLAASGTFMAWVNLDEGQPEQAGVMSLFTLAAVITIAVIAAHYFNTILVPR